MQDIKAVLYDSFFNAQFHVSFFNLNYSVNHKELVS